MAAGCQAGKQLETGSACEAHAALATNASCCKSWLMCRLVRNVAALLALQQCSAQVVA